MGPTHGCPQDRCGPNPGVRWCRALRPPPCHLNCPRPGKSPCVPRATTGMLEPRPSHGTSQAGGRFSKLGDWILQHSPIPNSYLIFFLRPVFFLKQQLLESCNRCRVSAFVSGQKDL